MLDDGTDIDDYISKLSKRNIQNNVVFHGIDTEFFKPSNIEFKQEKEFIILSNHRLIQVKRLDLAIFVFKRLFELANCSNLKLIFAGSGECIKNLENLVEKYNLKKYVNFIGEKNVEEIRDLIISSDIVIGTSLESNLNRSIQEAMACRKPVVVFDSGGTSKLIRHMENGLLVKSGDIDYFAEQLKLLYENPKLRETLGKNARETIVKERSWNTRIKKELEVYEKVLNE